MVANKSKKFPPLSAEFKEVQHEFKLLEKEAKELQKQQVQHWRDVRDGTIPKEQSEKLYEKLRARIDENMLAMFALTQKMANLK